MRGRDLPEEHVAFFTRCVQQLRANKEDVTKVESRACKCACAADTIAEVHSPEFTALLMCVIAAVSKEETAGSVPVRVIAGQCMAAVSCF